MFKSFLAISFVLSALAGTYAALPDSQDDNSSASSSSSSQSSSLPVYSDDCQTNSLEKSLYCRSSRAIRNIIHNLNKSEKPIVIVRGLEIVRSRDATANVTEEKANVATGSVNSADGSFLGRFSEYLRTHELNIKFSDLLAEESEHFLARDLERNGEKIDTMTGSSIAGVAGYTEEARKKDKGQGVLMAMALMFGKMMAVLGLGGIGALAMKALGVAMAALMMAGIVGLKSLAQHGGGHESSHSVQYLSADGHHHRRRRRRSLSLTSQMYANNKSNKARDPLDMVYRGWKNNATNGGEKLNLKEKEF